MAQAHEVNFPENARIFDEGHRAESFWIVRSGTVTLEVPVAGRRPAQVENLGPGELVGWSWLFPPYVWHLGAVALEPTLTVEFDGPAVLRLCAGDPELGYELTRRFITVVVERMQATRMRLTDVCGTPEDARHPAVDGS